MRADATNPAAIAEAAFVCTYPLVAGRRRMARATAVGAPDPGTMRAPVNAFVHGRATPDTLRCASWLDLANEPIVLSVPDTCGRYYALWLRDAWDRVFASVGARATGTGRQAFALLGPRDHAIQLPPGLTPIRAPTRTVHIGGRIEAVREADVAASEGFRLAPLNDSPGPPAELVAPPDERVDARTYFTTVLELAADDPPDGACRAALDRVRALGASAGLAEGVERGLAAVRPVPDSDIAHGWVRRVGEPAEDVFEAGAAVDSDRRGLSGNRRYLLRFAPDALPPAHGFWELTTGRNSIGDRHPLALDADGALSIHIQHGSPARVRGWNWLPAPAGAFDLALHLYWPREGVWAPPAIRRVD